jgi:hypothetical protein
MTVADLIIKLGLDSKGVTRGADTAVGAFNRIAKSATNFAAGFIGVGALERLSQKTVEYAGKINDLSTETGASTDALQEFDYAAEQNGAHLEDIGSALTKVAKAQVDALKGDSGKQNAFARLGVSLKDLKSLNPEEIFRKIAAAVKELPPSAQVTADVLDTLGKNAAALIPAFRGGFTEAADQARELGLIIDSETIKTLDDLGDEWQTIGRQLMAGIAPALKWLTDRFTDLRAKIAEFSGALGSLSVDFKKDKLGTIADILFPTAGKDNALGRARVAGEDAAANVYLSQMNATDRKKPTGGAPEAEEETRVKKIEDLRKKNADALEELYQKQLSREERITFLHQRRAEIAKQLANTTDGLKREELVAQDIDAIKGLQSLKKTSKSALSSPPQADDLARRGLFLGGIPQMNTLAQRQIQELRTVNRNLTQIDRSLNAE